MKVTVFGSGYVGLVTATCFADAGMSVVCVDVDESKIERLKNGEVPIFEPGLEELVDRGLKEGRLRFTTSAEEGVAHGLFQFIAVGTPPDEDGSADLKYVLQVAETIGRLMEEYRIVITKSTVPVGTADKVRETVADALRERNSELEFNIVSNPEFLKEGAAVADFTRPDRVVIGADNPRTAELMKALYAPFNRNHDRLLVMDIRSAELTKYAANAMLATKISFMNDLANLAERLGADIEQVRVGIGSDPRIGYQFIYPGCGYGGSCFPKDVKALIATASKAEYNLRLLEAVESINQDQKKLLFEKIRRHFNGILAGKTFAVWGLAFKPNTDDMREAPSRTLVESLWDAGAAVRVYDPEAMNEARRIWGERDQLYYADSPQDAATGSDALAVVTEWKVFRSPDFESLATIMRKPIIFDGRNVFDPVQMQNWNFEYYGIGRT